MTEDHRLIKSAKSARDGNVSEARIPDDIEIAARALNMKLHSATELGQRTQWIAEALLAENERCAKIAENYTVTTHMHWDEDRPVTRKPREASEIAEMIRRR